MAGPREPAIPSWPNVQALMPQPEAAPESASPKAPPPGEETRPSGDAPAPAATGPTPASEDPPSGGADEGTGVGGEGPGTSVAPGEHPASQPGASRDPLLQGLPDLPPLPWPSPLGLLPLLPATPTVPALPSIEAPVPPPQPDPDPDPLPPPERELVAQPDPLPLGPKALRVDACCLPGHPSLVLFVDPGAVERARLELRAPTPRLVLSPEFA